MLYKDEEITIKHRKILVLYSYKILKKKKDFKKRSESKCVQAAREFASEDLVHHPLVPLLTKF